MAMTSLPSFLKQLQQKKQPSPITSVSDALLLERFLQKRDETAFELLIWRHGAMVYGVCHRILRHAQDAEDAFQATFLTLARKAASISKRESIGGWLYMVAFRIALRANAKHSHRRRLEKPLDDQHVDDKSGDPAEASAWRELRRLLDSELSRIPEKYRTAFILCHLEGKTCDEAAEQLGCPRGTIQSRVSRARERLQARLTLRGWLPSATPLIHILQQHAAPLAQLSPVLVNATAHVAVLLAFCKSLAGVVSPAVLELVHDTLHGMYLRRLLYGVLLAFLLVLGGSVIVWGMLAPPQHTPSAGTGCSASQRP